MASDPTDDGAMPPPPPPKKARMATQAEIEAKQRLAMSDFPGELRNRIWIEVLHVIPGLEEPAPLWHLDLDDTNNRVTRVQDTTMVRLFLNDVQTGDWATVFKLSLTQAETAFAEFLSCTSQSMVFQFRDPKTLQNFAKFMRLATTSVPQYSTLVRLVLKWFDDSKPPDDDADQEDSAMQEEDESSKVDQLMHDADSLMNTGELDELMEDGPANLEAQDGDEDEGEEAIDEMELLENEADILAESSEDEEEDVKFPLMTAADKHQAHGYREKAREHVQAWVAAICELPKSAEVEIRIQLCQIWKDYMHLQDDTEPIRQNANWTIMVDCDLQPFGQMSDVQLHGAYSVAALTGRTIEKQLNITSQEATRLAADGCRGLRLPPGMTWP